MGEAWPGQCSRKIHPVARVEALVHTEGLGTWCGRRGCRGASGGMVGGPGALTAAEQGLVHEPDVGEALLTRLRDAHLVADEHVPIVLLDLGGRGGGR